MALSCPSWSRVPPSVSRIAHLGTQLNTDPARTELVQNSAMLSWLETLVEPVTIKRKPGHFGRSRVQSKWRDGVVPVKDKEQRSA